MGIYRGGIIDKTKMCERTSRGWRLNDRKVERSKWGDLQTEVTACRIQSPHSAAGNKRLSKNPGKQNQDEERGAGRLDV